MRRSLLWSTFGIAVASLLVLTAVAPVAGQTANAPARGAVSSWTAPRTPWGDPDLQGTFTNSSESGIPMERPAEFAGRRLEDVKPEELAKLIQQRAARQEKVAETIGGSSENDTGAGPPHWYENYNASNSRAWMIQDGPDYKMPATTDEAKKRAPGRVARGSSGSSRRCACRAAASPTAQSATPRSTRTRK